MIQNLLASWRTTSLGLTSILLAIVNLVFAIKNQTDSQSAWTIAITQIITGLGVMFSRDQAASRTASDATKVELDNVKSAIRTGDTSLITLPTK